MTQKWYKKLKLESCDNLNVFKKFKNACKNYGLDKTNIILICLVFLILGGYAFQTNRLQHIMSANHNQRIASHLRIQTENLLISDRVHHHQTRLPTTNVSQGIADLEAQKAYKQLPKQHQDFFSNQILHTNSTHDKNYRAKRLVKSSYKIHGVKYHSNIAEISFGKRLFHNQYAKHWHWHKITTTHSMANLVNYRMMQKSALSQKHQILANKHRKRILNKNNKSMGVSVIYNHQLNHGVLVETFSTHQY